MDRVNPVFARKLGLTKPPTTDAEDAPATPMRLMRRALARAADKAVGLSASVLGIAQEDVDTETLIETGPQGWIVLGLRDGANAGLTGLFLIDPALRSALIEMQTMGSLLPPISEQRAVTSTDAVMSVPFADQLLQELAEVGFGGTDLSPASYDIGPVADLRTAGLVMTQGEYRSWRITLQVGGGDAQGEIMIAMRPRVSSKPPPADVTPTWGAALREAVVDAPTDLDAVLCRMALSIATIENFEVGQVLRLAGTTVGSVKLIGPGNEDVAMARLGQVAGKRAVRIEPLQVHLEDAAPAKATPVAAPAVNAAPPAANEDAARDTAADMATQADLMES